VLETDSPTPSRFWAAASFHLSVLIETMRREGYELMVSQPQVIFKEGPNGEKLEPYEELVIDLDEAYNGPVIEELGRRGRPHAGDGASRRGPHATGIRHPVARAHPATARSSSPTRAAREFSITTSPTTAPTRETFKGRTNGVLIAQDPRPDNTLRLVLPAGTRRLVAATGRACVRRPGRGPARARQRHRRQTRPRPRN